eukprot:TRINITY_DN2709_c0_g1_i2.p1 TRINITY_DN2709_c0_g1~~TRINITY_DN2709_c0_g1_i2.p1  ORF type:complete len:192 (-),score=39.98 TRINITY_DN2709_c0_g1_i2:108-683(-)
MFFARVASLSLLAALACASEELMTAELPEDECAEGSCSLELRQLRVKQMAAAVASHNQTEDWGGLFDPSPPPAAAGSDECSSADKAAMEKSGGGNADGSFPKIVADCGKGAYSLFGGFKSGDMASCVASKTGISSKCAGCFADGGQFGYDNCKVQCLFGSWCSSLCLGCTKPHNEVINKCVGFVGPQVTEC